MPACSSGRTIPQSLELTPHLIGDLYEAAAQPDALLRLSGILRAVLEVDSAGIWLTDRGTISELAVTPDLAESIGPYLEHYARFDPWTIPAERLANRVTIGYEICPEADLVRTEFYNDFARPFGLFRPMGLVTELEPGLLARISLCRNTSTSLLQEEDKKTFGALAPHLCRALRTGLRFRAGPGGWAEAAFDRFGFGIVICESSGRVLYANAAALAFEAGGGLTLRGRPPRIGASVPQESERLARLVYEASTRQGHAGGALRVAHGESRALTVLVAPLPAMVADGFFGRGRALVSIQREDAVPGAAPAYLRSLYGLSPVQAELCRALAAGRTLEAAAAERGVAISTMRTHLKTVLARTGTENLRDLLRLLGAAPALKEG